MPIPKDPLKYEEWKQKISNSLKGARNPNFGKPKSDEWKRNLSEKFKGRWKGIPLSKERCKMMSESRKGKPRSDKIRENISRGHIESFVGGFWYGNVRYYEKKVYCELWNKELWERIDAFWNGKSAISGKTKEDNGGYALSRHHVYWQPKACCEWDEDKQGYYAWINIGTRKNKNWYKFYIKGNPNKFVLLTKREHGMVSKDKLKWIKIFEDIIESHGGKSYYSKEEMKKL